MCSMCDSSVLPLPFLVLLLGQVYNRCSTSSRTSCALLCIAAPGCKLSCIMKLTS
jgi:hypothetical protein